VLVITGFVPMIFLGKSITGVWLMVHATAAPVFAACVAILAVLWADNNRLDKNYWPWLNKILQRQPKSTSAPRKHELGLKISFWIIMVFSLPVILTAILSMFRIFGTDGQVVLLQLHRYSTLLLSLFAIIYLYLAALNEMEKTAGP
jgi:cytochrome b subunit of formate dehydrogenase